MLTRLHEAAAIPPSPQSYIFSPEHLVTIAGV